MVLPPGTVLRSSTVPVQTAVEDGRLKLGILHPGPEPLPVRLEIEPGDPGAVRPIEGDFRAEDGRNIVYWLEEPAEHRIRLALELLLDTPGQAHAFSVLLPTDQILEPVTLDVDRGVELPTRIVSVEEAALIPHAPSPLPDDAKVLVADLGYPFPRAGTRAFASTRPRSIPATNCFRTANSGCCASWPVPGPGSCCHPAGTSPPWTNPRCPTGMRKAGWFWTSSISAATARR